MLCMMCRGHATFSHTVFKGTSPTTVKLCPDCADKVRAEEHLRKIKEAVGHDAKTAAVDTFLQQLQQ